jgi:hypothetical protein
MAMSRAERQRRYRERQYELARTTPHLRVAAKEQLDRPAWH